MTPSVEVRPVFWVYLVVLSGLGWMLSGSMGLAEGFGRLSYGLIFAASSLLFLTAHETAHAVAGSMVGMTWTRIVFTNLRVCVELHVDGPILNRQQFWSSLAGPLAETALSSVVVVLSFAAGQPWNPVGLAAMLGLLEGVVNLLLPFPGLDGHQIVTAGRAMLAGRSNEPHLEQVARAA